MVLTASTNTVVAGATLERLVAAEGVGVRGLGGRGAVGCGGGIRSQGPRVGGAGVLAAAVPRGVLVCTVASWAE